MESKEVLEKKKTQLSLLNNKKSHVICVVSSLYTSSQRMEAISGLCREESDQEVGENS